MRRDLFARAAALALALAAPRAFAQDASVNAADATAVENPHVAAPGPVDPNAPMPPGHPPVDSMQGDPHGGDPHAGGGGGIHRAQLPEGSAEEASDLPPGVVVVRVVDAQNNPVPEASVRVGAMREGEPAGAQEIRTGPDGTARIERMETDGSVAYRLSTDHEGARFGAPPFQLPPNAGYRVQIVRHEVSHSPRAVLIWDARVEVRFKDERAIIVERVKIVNLTGMSLGQAPAHPTTYVPTEGLRFGIPEGHTAFVTQPSMSDVRLTEEGNSIVLRGSIPPTASEPVDVVFQYQMKLSGGDVDLRMTLPLSVVSASVATEAPPGLTLSVDGMPAAEAQEGDGERILMTGLERRPDDPAIQELHIHLGGIPRAAGPARTVATALAALVVFGALAYALSHRRRAAASRGRAEVEAERDRVLAAMADLAQQRADGDVGPVTYERRRRELAVWLASLLKELDANSAQRPA